MALITDYMKSVTATPMEGANLAVLQDIMDQIDSGKLDFYEKPEAFKIQVKLSDFNLMQFDAHLYTKINLPFQVSVYNNTFMSTDIFRLVSRKLPNTINWFTDIQLPMSVDIGETKSFLIYLSIDDLDDIDWLVDNDLAFMLYTDNTTLAEIDFAIRCPDIRGITQYKKHDSTYDLDDWYAQGLMDFEDIVAKSFKIDEASSAYHKLKDFQNIRDMSSDTTYGQDAINSILKDIQDNDKLKDVRLNDYPADFIENVINMREIKSFRDKFKFTIHKFTYYDGIMDSSINIGFEDAKKVWNNWKSENQSLININMNRTDISTQKTNLSGLAILQRVPFFGSEFMYVDLIYYVLNIRDKNVLFREISDMGKFVGDFIRMSQVVKEDPNIQSIVMKYDISSQVKENLTTFESFTAPDWALNPDETKALGFKIMGNKVHLAFPDLINANDITISYYYTNPILANKRNWVVYEHSAEFRDKLVNYDWAAYFGIDSTDPFPDNTIHLYTVDWTVHKWYQNTITGDQTQQAADWTISNTISVYISNEVKNSFEILSTHSISNGSSTLLLADTTKDINIFCIDKVEIFNNGNTFLQITDINLFMPNGRYDLESNFENTQPSDIIKQGQIAKDTDFYQSMFDSQKPVDVMAFNSLAPGETGDIYIVYRLNRNMLNSYLTDFFKIPVFTRIEFNSSMAAYFGNVPSDSFSTLGRYNNWQWTGDQRNAVGHAYPFFQQMFNPLAHETAPPDEWIGYGLTNTIWDHSNIYWKSQFHHDVAYFAGATVSSNKFLGTSVNISNGEPYDKGLLREGKSFAFNWMFILPTPVNMPVINKIDDLVALYEMSIPTDLDYRFYTLKFDMFFNQFIQDIKNNYYLVSMIPKQVDAANPTIKCIYFRYNPSNEYSWYNYELTDITSDTKAFDLSWLSQFTATITLNVPETIRNSFTFSIPKPLEFVNIGGPSVTDMVESEFGGKDSLSEDDIKEVSGQTTSKSYAKGKVDAAKRQYFHDRFWTGFDMGQIVGNKQLTMAVNTKFFNLFRIKSFDNFEIASQGIGPGIPDVYSMRIVKPDLTYANIIFEFFKHDYTCELKQDPKPADTVAANAGNYMITPNYYDLGYLPIDETYQVMCKVTNQNPYQVPISIVQMDSETANAIQLTPFPDNAEYNKMYLYLAQRKIPYTMLPSEEVRLFFTIVPRRIGMNFFTVYLNINGSIRPINFEFRSFINNKAYFVLDNDSKLLDFGDVPIGKFEEQAIVVQNIGNVVGKINSIYVFGNDSQFFKLLDRDKGSAISERLSWNKVVKPKTSLAIPVRFYSQSYGFNYSYAYIETNEPVLQDAQWYDGTDDNTQLYRNAPKYLASLLKGNAVIEDDIIDTDSYIFLGYVHPLKSKFRSYEITLNNKNRNKIVSIFKVTNLMKNYISIKYTKQPFDKSSSVYIQLNPRAYTEGWYYDELFIWMVVTDRKTRQSKFVLNKIPVSWYVTREQRLSFDVDLEEIIFASKPFLKSYRKVNIRNYSNDDATIFLNMLTDCSGLFTLVPELGNQTFTIPEGVNWSFLLTFGGDQRFIGKYDTMLTIQLTLGDETITKYVPVTGIVGDQNIVKFYKRAKIMIA